MLKILEAIQFNSVFTKGGRTEPWLIQVMVDGERAPYVVKLFTTDDVDHDNTVAREVFGSVLATEFDLPVPRPALVNFSRDFVRTLPDDVREILYQRDDRLKFASAFCENTSLLLPELPVGQIKKIISDATTIYAFDTLINNKDRGNYKTNILISNESDSYFIIDHERAFKNMGRLLADINSNQFSDTLQLHVLHHYLSNKKDKSSLFAEFHEFLKVLNINKLDSYNSFLRKYNLGHNDIVLIKSYLSALKQKSGWFVNILLNSITK